MLDATLKTQLQGYLTRLQQPIELIAALDEGEKSKEMRVLLEEIVALSDKISLREDAASSSLKPSFAIQRVGASMGIRFAAIPLGHEFTSLVLALLQAGGHPPKVDAAVIEQIKGLAGKFEFETFVSLSCHNCPDIVQALNLMAVVNPDIRHTTIDGALFQDEVA